MPDELDELKKEDALRAQQEFYDTLEEKITELRIEVRAQAVLLKEFGMMPTFLDRVLELEHLQQKWDEWEEEEEETQH